MEQAYSTYKDSGVEWIGKIPKDWKSVNLKWISNITKGRKPKVDYDEGGKNLLPYLSMEFLRDKTDYPTYASIEENGLVLVDDDDILILWDGSKAGEIVKAKKGVLSSTMAKIDITDSDFESNYLNYLLQLGERHIQDNTIGMGIPHVSGDVLKGLKILLPSPQEQTQIAAYLDYHTGKIDALITKKETLIQKLQEQRQAIINEAVTKGLNPEVEMKASGIEWLGEIPKHWSASYLKRFTEKITDGAHHSPKTELEGKNYVSVKDVDEFGNIDLEGCKKISDDDFELLVRNGCQPEIGDVLLTKDGTIGRAAIVENNDFVILSSLGLIRPKREILNENYLRYFLISGLNVTQMYSMIAGAALTRLTIEKIKHLVITLPPLEEQIEIAFVLDKKIYQMDVTIKEVKASIQKLKDYRQSLISEAVTGKIDVRGWQQPNS